MNDIQADQSVTKANLTQLLTLHHGEAANQSRHGLRRDLAAACSLVVEHNE